MGKALLQAAEKEVKYLGADAMVAWGLSIPEWMKARWFKKQGYKKVDKNGMQVLLWKPFNANASPPKWIRKNKEQFFQPVQGKLTITAFKNGWCPVQNIVYERTKRASEKYMDKIIFQEIDTMNRDNLRKYGITDSIFIEKKLLRSGPPPSYEKIKKKIEKAVKRMR